MDDLTPTPVTEAAVSGLPTEEQVLEALKVVKDPEIPVNVVDLGLIYGVDINPDGVNEVNVEFVWTPPWGPDKMTEDGKRQMRMFGFNL
jgi:metal-sulfur cluster biosynthetic enzyme